MSSTEAKPTVEGIRRRIVILTGLGAACWWLAVGEGSWGVVAGGSTILASVWLFERLFDAAISKGRRRLATGLVFVKLAAFLGIGWLAFHVPSWLPHPVGFAVGVSALPMAAVWEALKMRRS